MMRLVVFGATGPTGQYFVKQALASGHYVHALVRSPDNLTTDNTRLTKSRVNIFNPEEIHSHLSGSDALISCLGTRKLALFDRSKVTLYTESLQSIVEAMRMSRTKRLVCLSSWGARRPLYLQRTMGIFPIGRLLDNMLEMEEYLDKHCSDIHHTVVKPAGLLQKEASELPLLTSDQERVPGCRMTIARGDVARFLLQCVEQGTWINSCVAIGVRKQK